MTVEHSPHPVDPFAPTVDGVYRDDMVEVHRAGHTRPRRTRGTVRTPHFDLLAGPERVRLVHGLGVDDVDDDLAGLLAEELFGPGWLRGPELFERTFAGIVRTVAPEPLDAWGHFYGNTLDRLAEGSRVPTHAPGAHGTLAGYAPVYAHAAALVEAGSVLEMGCCFGFFSLRLAAAGRNVIASDVSPGTMRLLAGIAPRLGVRLTTMTADAAHVPCPDRSVDTVLALHLLEHLDPEHGDRVVAEALRLAARRVIVAVPLEDVPDHTWGHVRTVGLDDLDRWGAATGLRYDVHEFHGGWLVVDA